ARTRLTPAAVLSLGTPDLVVAARSAGVVPAVERVMELAPWPNPRNPRAQRLVAEFLKRSGGRPLDAASGYAHEAVLVVADALECQEVFDDDAPRESSYVPAHHRGRGGRARISAAAARAGADLQDRRDPSHHRAARGAGTGMSPRRADGGRRHQRGGRHQVAR